jgi:hypothetical protein
MIGLGLLAAIKIIVSILMVVILSLIAERAGPRLAGIASGYPLGAAISLFFIGLELGPAFAARSAVFTAAGLAATVAFVGGYLAGLNLAAGGRRPAAVVLAILPALAAYGLTAWVLSRIPMTWLSAPAIAAGSMLAAGRLFRSIPDVAIRKTIPLTPGITLLRAAFAAGVILVITGAARYVGPGWAGLFSAFPITMLPLLVIVQYTYAPDHVRTIIKNVPRGLGALLVYTLTIGGLYDVVGIGWGTLLGYLAATAYLVLLEYLARRNRAG